MSISSKEKKIPLLGRSQYVEMVLELTNPVLSGWKVKKMTIVDACKKIGITPVSFHNWMKEDPVLKDAWETALSIRKELVRVKARDNIYEAIDWDIKLRPREKIEISKWFLEKTDNDFNPKSQVDVKSMNMNFDVSMEELQEKLKSYIS